MIRYSFDGSCAFSACDLKITVAVNTQSRVVVTECRAHCLRLWAWIFEVTCLLHMGLAACGLILSRVKREGPKFNHIAILHVGYKS